MATPLYVFAYGSLMSEPASPGHVVGRERAVLRGWRRVFHQESRTRGCPPHAAPDVAAVPGFVSDGGVRYSLALGLVQTAIDQSFRLFQLAVDKLLVGGDQLGAQLHHVQ
ncbi:MAG: hypothetical protein AAF211_12825, partial [Myxococcota bacterium]